jgi:hypothetical protein
MTHHIQTTAVEGRLRAKNTLFQGLIAAVLVGVCGSVLQALNAGHISWQTLAVSVVTTAVTSGVAYAQHAWLAPYLAVKNAGQ